MRRHPECGVADRKLDDDVVALPDAMQDGRAERRLIELNCRTRALHPQLRLDAGHRGSW